MPRKSRQPTLGEEAIERILTAAGSEHIPPDLDRKQLLRDLAEVETLAFLVKYSMTAPKRKSLFLQAARRARALLAFASRHRLDLDLDIPSPAPVQPVVTPALGMTLTALAEAFQQASHRPRVSIERAPEAWRYRGGSVSGWLAGTVLTRMFELHFRAEPKVERPRDRTGKRRADGPYVRFAKQCLRELGINYKAESIARALEDARREQRRHDPEPRSRHEALADMIERGGWLGLVKNERH
jgi:hypothetical protein